MMNANPEEKPIIEIKMQQKIIHKNQQAKMEQDEEKRKMKELEMR